MKGTEEQADQKKGRVNPPLGQMAGSAGKREGGQLSVQEAEADGKDRDEGQAEELPERVRRVLAAVADKEDDRVHQKVDQIAGLAYRSQDRMIQQTPQGGGHPDDHEHEKGKEKTRQLHQTPVVGRGGTVKRQAQGQDSESGRDGNGKAGCPMRLKVSARLSDREKGGGHSQKEGEGAGVGSVIDAGGIVIRAIEEAGLQHGQKGQEDQKPEADPPQAEFPDPRTEAVEQKQKQGPDEIVLEGQPQKPEVGKRGTVGETGEVAGVLGNLPEVVKAKEDAEHFGQNPPGIGGIKDQQSQGGQDQYHEKRGIETEEFLLIICSRIKGLPLDDIRVLHKDEIAHEGKEEGDAEITAGDLLRHEVIEDNPHNGEGAKPVKTQNVSAR